MFHVLCRSSKNVKTNLLPICKTCFFWLRQLRRVSRSLDTESLKTLVHAFVTSRVDYCNSVLASSPKTITDELQRVLNAAARLISGTGKYDRGLSRLLNDELHWLDIPQRVQYKLAVTVHRCLRSRAPTYLADHCIPISEVAGCQHLRSARRQQLNVPRIRRVTVVAPLHPPVRQSGIHCRIISAIRLSDRTSFNEN